MSEIHEIAKRMSIPELVREYDLAMHEIKQGLAMLKQAETRLRCFIGEGRHFGPEVMDRSDFSLDFEPKRIRLRGEAWRYLVDRTEIKKMASIRQSKEIDDMLRDPKNLPEITVDNLSAWIQALHLRAGEFLEEAAVEVYRWLRPPSRRYKTNDPFKLGKRVVISGVVEGDWTGRGKLRPNHYQIDKLRALDSVFHMLDGQGVSKTRDGELADAIRGCLPGETNETKFFRFRPFKNGNLHVEFLRPDLVQKLNALGGNGLPMPEEGRAA